MSGFCLIDFDGIFWFEFFGSCASESLIEETPKDFEFLAESAINCNFDGSCIKEARAGITPPVTKIRQRLMMVPINPNDNGCKITPKISGHHSSLMKKVKIPKLKANHSISVKWKVNPLYLENDISAKDDSGPQLKGRGFTTCSDLKSRKTRLLMTVPIKPNDNVCKITPKISCQHSSLMKEECTAPSVKNHRMLINKVPSSGKGIAVLEKPSALSRRKQLRMKDDLTNGTKPASTSKEHKMASKFQTASEDSSAAIFFHTEAMNSKVGEWLFSWKEACRWRAEIMSNIINKEEWLVSLDEACRWREERMLSLRKIKNKCFASMESCIIC